MTSESNAVSESEGNVQQTPAVADGPGLSSWTPDFGDELPGGQEYGRTIEALRSFLDDFAGAHPDESTLAELTASLASWSQRLRPVQVNERQQIFAQRVDLPGYGQTMSPLFMPAQADADSLNGTVTFGRYFLGGGGAAHGGAITLLFDEVLGGLTNMGGRPASRTAYLKVDFRAIAPLDVELQVETRVTHEEGRKIFARGWLRNGETVCAEAEGLWVTLLPGQR